MKGRELILRSLQNQTVPRPAWIPFVGVHGAKLIGISAEEYLQSTDALVAGLLRARELYRPDALPVAFDLQMEAEVLGCRLQWGRECPPSVAHHPMEDGLSLPDLPVFDTSLGRYPIVLDSLKRLRREFAEEIALYGLVCGPFTLALHLAGNRLFLQMFDHPDYVSALIAFCASVGRKAAMAYLENGADVVAVVDPMTSQISPEHFEGFVLPALNQIFTYIREKKGLSSLFVCGDAGRNLEIMCRSLSDNISIDENIPLEKVRDYTRFHGKSFGGNLKLTSALLLGDEDDCRLDAIRCIDIGGNCGFILAPGCDLPFHTPESNLRAIAEMVHDPYRREIAKRTIIAKSQARGAEVPLPNYAALPFVTIDVVTLDSASCAPCQYMMEAVHHAVARADEPVRVHEHRITTREGLAMMSRLKVVSIPSICMDGEVVFSSLIPDQKTLESAIMERSRAKGV